MDDCLKTCKLPTEQGRNMNKPITNTETESVI